MQKTEEMVGICMHLELRTVPTLPQSAEAPEIISISALEASQKTHWPPRDQALRQRTP